PPAKRYTESPFTQSGVPPCRGQLCFAPFSKKSADTRKTAFAPRENQSRRAERRDRPWLSRLQESALPANAVHRASVQRRFATTVGPAVEKLVLGACDLPGIVRDNNL